MSHQVHETIHIEATWDVGEVNDYIEIDKIFVGSDFLAASVDLSTSQAKVFLSPGSVPHILLTKHSDCAWTAIGPWVKAAVEASDWQVRSDGSSYSPSLKITSYSLGIKIAVVCTIHIDTRKQYLTAYGLGVSLILVK